MHLNGAHCLWWGKPQWIGSLQNKQASPFKMQLCWRFFLTCISGNKLSLFTLKLYCHGKERGYFRDKKGVLSSVWVGCFAVRQILEDCSNELALTEGLPLLTFYHCYKSLLSYLDISEWDHENNIWIINIIYKLTVKLPTKSPSDFNIN